MNGHQWRQSNRIPKAAMVGALAALPIGAVNIGVHWASVHGPRWLEIPGVELLFLPGLVAAALVPIFLLAALIPRARVACLAIACAFGSAFLVQVACTVLASEVRLRGFRTIAIEARPLLKAIYTHHRLNGAPPVMLAELPPEVLRGQPPFHYFCDADTPYRCNGNPWVLSLDAGTGFLNWDQFLYYPLQNYPRVGHGGSLEPVEEWAYVHE